MPLLPVAALIACLDRPNSHVALRNSLGALSLGAQFDLLEEGGYDTDILQLLQQLAGLLEVLRRTIY
ncbi:hypothetical protein EON64_00995 [archaeon]|nr:MAG: hypothetical protein EON64_00995 [archaeon]